MESEDLTIYADFFHKAPEMLCVAGFDGLFKELNPAWERVLGFAPADMLGHAAADFVYPADRDGAEAGARRMVAGESQVSFEARFPAKDGSLKWLLWRCAADPEKKIFHGVVVDITPRKMTETALRESGGILRKILNLAPMAMAIVNIDGTIEYINRKAEQAFGFAHTEIPTLDKWWVRAYPDEKYRAEVVHRWNVKLNKAILERTEIDGGEYNITCKDGKRKTVFIFGVIAAEKVFVMFDDITRRVEAERELRESESRYRALVETTRTGYVIINKEGRVLDANTEYVRLTGRRDLKEVLGRNVLDWTAPHSKENNAAAIAQCARDGHISDFEVDYTDAAGGNTPVEVNASVVARGGVPQILTLCRDISARRRAEAEIRGLNQNLEERVRARSEELIAANNELVAEISQRLQAERAKEKLQERLLQSQKLEAVGRLAGGIAHDFNNILVSISGYAELLQDTMPPGAPARADLAEILLETERGAALTHQLLTFSTKQEIKLEVLDINSIAADSEKMLKRLIGANMHLETHLADGLCSVKADPGQISQIIINLIINARDAMPDGGRLIMRTRNAELGEENGSMRLVPAPGSYAELSVSDTGGGMTPETMSHLFEPFYTTKKPGQGTGLGLSTVYGIVSHARGGISVESAPGRGTTFRIYLPRADQPA
ncbi:MAG TPA: hypothetical protein DCS63_08770 [Elusimicrobia bacterium]|nr:hypothetical protein [Elusimicrobiota bacterium]